VCSANTKPSFDCTSADTARVIAPLEHQNLLKVGRCDRDSSHKLGRGVRHAQHNPRNLTIKHYGSPMLFAPVF
jgi:hypothetical protein